MASYREIIYLAFPSIITNITYMLLPLIDLLTIGGFGNVVVSSLGLSRQIINILSLVSTAVSIGVTAIVARRVGEERDEAAFLVYMNAIFLSLAISVPVMIVVLEVSGDIFRFMNAPPEVVTVGTIYLSILGWNIPIMFLSGTVSSGLAGAGDTKTPFYASLLTLSAKTLLNILLVRGVSTGEEAMRAIGFASIASSIIGLSALLLLFAGNKLIIKRTNKGGVSTRIMRKILEIGVPGSFERLISSFAMFTYTWLIMKFGTEAMSAQTAGMTIEGMSFMQGVGISVAVASLAGRRLGGGREDEAEDVIKKGVKISFMTMVPMAVLLFSGATAVASILTPRNIEKTALYLRIMSFQHPFLAAYIVMAGGLRGSGETKAPLLISSICSWGIRVGLGLILGMYVLIDVVGVWMGALMDFIVRTLLIYWVYRKGAWKKIEI